MNLMGKCEENQSSHVFKNETIKKRFRIGKRRIDSLFVIYGENKKKTDKEKCQVLKL